MLDIFPDRISRRLDHHTSFYTCVIDQLCFLHNVCVPLCKIIFHRSDCFYEFLVFRHTFLLLFFLPYTVSYMVLLFKQFIGRKDFFLTETEIFYKKRALQSPCKEPKRSAVPPLLIITVSGCRHTQLKFSLFSLTQMYAVFSHRSSKAGSIHLLQGSHTI